MGDRQTERKTTETDRDRLRDMYTQAVSIIYWLYIIHMAVW